MTHNIIEELNKLFVPMDIDVLENSIKWIDTRIVALNDFKQSEEAKELRKQQFIYYDKLFNIAGGKNWYKIIYGRNVQAIHEIVEKNCKQVVTNRNYKIATKLEKLGITEIISKGYTYTDDGFDGFYIVNTNSGEKYITINTILAGGYNVQCRHLRVLVKVK